MNKPPNLRAFDMDSFVNNNFSNSVFSLELLREKSYWKHFEIIANSYQDLSQVSDPALSSTHSKMALLHFLSGCSVNLVKGVSIVLSGHFTDSSLYVRRTIESIRYSAFIRDNPECAEIWFRSNGKKEFQDKYRKWWTDVGKTLMEDEFDRSGYHFNHSSNYGPHPNAELFYYQHNVTYEGKKMDFRILYHELEPSERGYHSLLGIYFWHLKIHAASVEWWLRRSKFPHQLSPQQISFWADCKRELDRDCERVTEIIREGPLGGNLA